MNSVLDKIQSPPAVAIADRVRQLERSGEKIAKLQTGEPCFNTPEYIKEAAIEAIRNNKTQYTSSQGIPELRSAIAKWYGNSYKVNILADNILITQGAVGGIYCVAAALLNIGDEVILADPAWPQYDNIIKLNRAVSVRISTRKNNGKLTPELLKQSITAKTRMVIINNPSNPTGIVYNRKEINEFVLIAKTHDLFIMFDEVYNRLVYSDGFCSVLNCPSYEENKSRIIYVNSFSKTFAMTGWRIGYAFMDPVVLKKALLVSQNILTNISTFSQYAAVVAIEQEKNNMSVFEEMKKVYSSRNNQLIKILSDKGMEFMRPEGAFYIFIKMNTDSVNFAKTLLDEEKMAVVPGESYGEDFKDYIRISFAVDDYSYNKFVEWLKAYKN